MPGITIQIMGDGAGAADALRVIEERMQQTKEKGAEMSERLAEAGERIRGAFELAGIGLGIREVVDGLKEAVEKSIELGTELGHLSEKTGISVQDLSALKFAGEETGLSFETLQKGVKKLAVSMYDAESGKKESVKNFQNLGISMEEVRARSNDLYGMLALVGDKFKTMPDGPLKLAEAQKIFGKSGLDLIPMLNEGAEGIEEYRAKARALGLELNDVTVAKMKELHRSVVEMKGAWSGLALQLTSEAAPALETIGRTLIALTPTADDYAAGIKAIADAYRDLMSVMGNGLSADELDRIAFFRRQMNTDQHAVDSAAQSLFGAWGKPKGHGVDDGDAAGAAAEANAAVVQWDKILAKWNSVHSQGMRDIITRSHEEAADLLQADTIAGKKAWDQMGTDAVAAIDKAFKANPPVVKLETETSDPLGPIKQPSEGRIQGAEESASLISGFMDNLTEQALRGKVSFRSLVDSAIADLERWAMKVMEEKALTGVINAMFGLGGSSNIQFGDSGNVSTVNGVSTGTFMAGGGDLKGNGDWAVVGDTPSGNLDSAELFAPKGPGSVLPNDVLKGIAAGRGGSGAPSVMINNINNSSQPVDMKQGGMSWDASAKQFIIHTVLEDAASGGPVAGMLGGFARG